MLRTNVGRKWTVLVAASWMLCPVPRASADDFFSNLGQAFQQFGQSVQNSIQSATQSAPGPYYQQPAPVPAPVPSCPPGDVWYWNPDGVTGSCGEPAAPPPPPAPARPTQEQLTEQAVAREAQVVAPPNSTTTVSMCDGSTSMLNDDDVSYFVGNDCTEFSITNSGSPRINPLGSEGFSRVYNWVSMGNSREEESLQVTDQSSNGDASQTTMISELFFFPRRVLPAIRQDQATGRYVVTIPTGETVEYDGRTHEIVGGVLQETAPLDTRANAAAPAFAALSYSGKGIVMRSDQRGESTRAAVVWGQPKSSVIEYQGQTCTVSNAELFDQSNAATSEVLPFRFPTDDGFYQFLRSRCGWQVDASSFAGLSSPSGS